MNELQRSSGMPLTVSLGLVQKIGQGKIQAKTSLSKSTVAAVLLQSGRFQDALINPQAFIDQVAGAINDTKRDLLVGGVEYVKVGGAVYEMHRFKAGDLVEGKDTIQPCRD